MNIEQYAKRIRQILGQRNDDSKAVFDLIDELCEENDRLKMRVRELENACINLSSKRIADMFNEPPMKAWLLEEKADAIESCGRKMLEEEDPDAYMDFLTPAEVNEWLQEEADCLRRQSREVLKARSEL